MFQKLLKACHESSALVGSKHTHSTLFVHLWLASHLFHHLLLLSARKSAVVDTPGLVRPGTAQGSPRVGNRKVTRGLTLVPATAVDFWRCISWGHVEHNWLPLIMAKARAAEKQKQARAPDAAKKQTGAAKPQIRARCAAKSQCKLKDKQGRPHKLTATARSCKKCGHCGQYCCPGCACLHEVREMVTPVCRQCQACGSAEGHSRHLLCTAEGLRMWLFVRGHDASIGNVTVC